MGDRVATLIFTVGFLVMFTGPAIWAFQIVHWVISGAWFPISLGHAAEWLGWSRPSFGWSFIQAISDLFLHLPLSVALIVGALLALLLYVELPRGIRHGPTAE